jgi:hypothetical protein
MRSRQAGLSTLAAALLWLAPAAAGANPAANPDTPDPQQSGSIAEVKVNNLNAMDVDVYAVTEAGRKFALGTVYRASARSLALPEQIADGATEFRLKIYSVRPSFAPSSYKDYLKGVKTTTLSAAPGSTLSLIVGDPLTDSFVNYVH